MSQHPIYESIELDAATFGTTTSALEYVHAAAVEFIQRGNAFAAPVSLDPERTLTSGELEALKQVGMAPTRATADRAEKARKDSLYAFFHIFRTSLPTSAVASMLGVNPSRIRQRIKERTLLALSDGGESRFPAVQFHSNAELPGLRIALPALPAGISTLEAVAWLSTPSVDLAGLDADDEVRPAISPRDYLLQTGDGTRVAELAGWLRAD